MSVKINNEDERLIEKKILARFETEKEEEIQLSLHAVADDLRAQGRDDITYETVRQVYMAVMMY